MIRNKRFRMPGSRLPSVESAMQLMVGLDVGTKVGAVVGTGVGGGVYTIEGEIVGSGDGGIVGCADGGKTGCAEGAGLGGSVGSAVGSTVGTGVGVGVGNGIGMVVGCKDGSGVGVNMGIGLGLKTGAIVGTGTGIRVGNCDGGGTGIADGWNDIVGSTVGIRIMHTSQVSSQMPALGQVRQNETEQYAVTYSQKPPTSSQCVGRGVGGSVIVGSTEGSCVGLCEGFRVLAMTVIELLTTETSRVGSALDNAVMKSSDESTDVTIKPTSAEDERSPFAVVERGDDRSKDTSHVTESKFRRLLFSMVEILKFLMAVKSTPA